MEAKDLRFKIINKTKEGCTIDFTPRGKRFLSWDEFNAEYVIVDKIYAKLNEEALKKLEELDDAVADAVAALIAQRSTNAKFKMMNLLELPEHVKRVADLIGGNTENAMNLISKRYHQAVKQLEEEGVLKKDAPKPKKVQNNPPKNSKSVPFHIDKSKKPTLGSLFTEEQLKKLKK